jgi:2,5-diketo-D-gluconate reductase A
MQALPVPRIQLNDGNSIAQLGIGTYKLRGSAATEITDAALDLGYRHIDTASYYENEEAIGQALAKSPVAREDVFLTSKIWPSEYSDPRTALQGSLTRLGVNSLDLYLLHWPVPMFGTAWRAWADLVELRDQKLTRSIGVSNFEIPHLKRIISETGVVPAVNQIELHPEHQRRELVEFCFDNDIAVEAWCPIARARASLLQSPAVSQAARAHGVTPAQAVLRWHIQRGHIIFPKTQSEERLRENAKILEFSLTDSEVKAIDALDSADPQSRIGGDPNEFTR